jgi:tetratricopeptide (TPR) repeat protein
LKIRRVIGDRRGEGSALNNLGNAYVALSNGRKAMEFYEKALVIAREVGDREGEGDALFGFALGLDNLGDRAQAIARAEAALKIRGAIGNPNAAKVRAKLNEWRGESLL